MNASPLTMAQQIAQAAILFQQQRTNIVPKAATVETIAGTVVHAFTSGTMVQVFPLDRSIPEDVWNTKQNQ